MAIDLSMEMINEVQFLGPIVFILMRAFESLCDMSNFEN